MPSVAYETWTPSPLHAEVIRQANRLCRAYAQAGYNPTLRQLYYRFVAMDLFPDDRRWRNANGRWVRDPSGTKNAEPNYNWLGELLNRARLAGLLDWEHMVDRLRDSVATAHWDQPEAVVDSAARSFRLDKWATQDRRVEIWVEKDALSDVVARVAREYDIAYFACRGYVSQSAQWRAAQRLGEYIAGGQAVTILYLGDHDPSGLDMTEDITGRLKKFLWRDWFNQHTGRFGRRVTVGEIIEHMAERVGDPTPFEVVRVALNMDQIGQHQPPPNPTKLTDSRARKYIDEYGYDCWELDALPPEVLADLIRAELDDIRQVARYEEIEAAEAAHRRLLELAAARWDDVARFLETEAA